MKGLENIDVLFTPQRAGRGPSTIRQVLLKKLHNCPVDIVAMLAVAMCQIPLSAQPESDSAYAVPYCYGCKLSSLALGPNDW